MLNRNWGKPKFVVMVPIGKDSVDALKGPVLQAGGHCAVGTDGERAEAVCPSE